MKIIDFRKITTNDLYDEDYNDGSAWSRVYEYPLVFETVKRIYKNNYLLHNTSWGFEGVHILFKNKLEKHFNVENSDIRDSNMPNTFRYDITTKNSSLKEKYDIVINISTLEEVDANHIDIFFNLLDQVKNNGYLICTFDLPGLQVHSFEHLFGKKILEDQNSISGKNSKLPNLRFSNLNCGFMFIQK
jgi:hypothetical protein